MSGKNQEILRWMISGNPVDGFKFEKMTKYQPVQAMIRVLLYESLIGSILYVKTLRRFIILIAKSYCIYSAIRPPKMVHICRPVFIHVILL